MIIKKLCSLDCLGIEERRDDSNYVYKEFQKQLGRGPGDFYDTNLIWKDSHPPLKINKSKTLGRLSSKFITEKPVREIRGYSRLN